MRFSIIIPAFNSASYIKRALDSIKEQTFEDYELIVVCDSCIDNTKEIAEQYADKVYDITADVINGLNKAYKSKAAAATAEKKTEKK